MDEYNFHMQKILCDATSDSGSDTNSSMESNTLENTVRYSVSKLTEKNIKRNGVERLPTRRPDPKVYNRNALLARENRRKKKVHLETMETELQEIKSKNRGLLKMMKKQLKIVKRLEHEKSYYKSIITNQPEILNLLTALNSQLPAQKLIAFNSMPSLHNSSFTTSPTSSLRRSSCSSTSYINDQESPLAINFEAASENGSVANNVVRQDAFLSPCPSASPENETETFFNNLFNDTFTDYEPSSYDGSLHEILEEYALKTEVSYDPVKTTDKSFEAYSSDIPEDHNYVCKETKATDDIGVCLHIGRNKVTLEFCPSCHWNASYTLPTELMQTKDV